MTQAPELSDAADITLSFSGGRQRGPVRLNGIFRYMIRCKKNWTALVENFNRFGLTLIAKQFVDCSLRPCLRVNTFDDHGTG